MKKIKQIFMALLSNLQVPTKLIANCHLVELLKHHSSKRYHHFIFGFAENFLVA
jgi:hypothetical protein